VFDFVFLGTSASAPSVNRGLSAHMVLHREHRFLIDCGEGTQRQILRSGFGFKRLTRILITHGHLDHILGLAGLLSTLTRWEAIEYVEIWAGRSALDRIRNLIYGVVFRGAGSQVQIELKELEPGPILVEESFELEAFPVNHRGGQCFGFMFQEPERRPFLDEKASELGVPHGPERRELVRGCSIELPGGQTINPDDVLGPTIPGTKLVHVGDAGTTDDLLEYCTNADALVIEATYLDSDKVLAEKFGHLTARQAAELARDANVSSLYLTHISRRYRIRDVMSEAAKIFPTVVVARDLDQFQTRRPNSA
jgi:ribonuclease Z